jgi:hypothetical protein
VARIDPRPAGDGPDATTWWYWVRPRLTTTWFVVTDGDGEWVGAFDRRGNRGRRARAQDLERDRIDLAIEERAGRPRATHGENVIAEVSGDRLLAGGQWLELDLPRDATFSCTVRRGDADLLRIARFGKSPFARVDFAPGLPDPAAVILLLLFVLTFDHDEARVSPYGGGT